MGSEDHGHTLVLIENRAGQIACNFGFIIGVRHDDEYVSLEAFIRWNGFDGLSETGRCRQCDEGEREESFETHYWKCLLLKLEVKCKLHLTHAYLHIRDLAGAQVIDCRVWSSKVHVVEYVEC